MNILSLNRNRLCFLAATLVSLVLFACRKENNGSSSTPPVIEFVRLVDSTKRDSTFTTSLTGTWVVIHGQHFEGIRSIYFNDMPVPFNATFVTGSDVILLIPANIPTEANNPDVSNKIRLVTDAGEAVFDFKLVPPAPSIRSVSNEMAFPGETITLRGTDYFGIQKIIFPGNLEGTNMTVIDTATITVTVPSALTETGPLQVVGKYGTGTNPFILFNDTHQPGMLANFEDGDSKFGWAWWGGIKTNDATMFPGNRGNYIRIHPAAGVNAGDGAWYQDNRAVNVAEQDWLPQSSLGDPVANYALKFEVFVKTPWRNGTILIRNEGSWKYTARYAPWKSAANGVYQTTGWVTVTIPLTEFRTKANGVDGSGNPAASLTDLLGSGKREVGLMLINDSNTKIADFDAAFDNVRIVRI